MHEGIHPFQGQTGYKDRVPACFGRKWWVVFKDNEEAVLSAIGYAERNPIKAGLKPQTWSFVVKYPQLYQPVKLDEGKGEE